MSNFTSVSSLGDLVTYKNATPQDVLVTEGKYVGKSQNQFGALYNFIELGTGKKKTLVKCGKLEWLDREGIIKLNAVYRIIYLGRQTIEKGAYKGKEFHDLDVLQDLGSVTPSTTATPAVESKIIDDILA